MPAILLSVILMGIRPQLAGVSLRPGLHSYQQLATELTDQGMAARCDPAIVNRFALIRVPQMAWESLKPVLEAALDVQFVMNQYGILEIKKDMNKAEIEDALLKRFSRRYSLAIQSAVQDGFNDYLQLSAMKARREPEDPVTYALAAIKSLPSGSQEKNAMNVAINLADMARRRYQYAQLWDGIDLAKLLKDPSATTTSSEQIDEQYPVDNPIGEILPPAVRTYGVSTQDGEPCLPKVLIERWRVDARSFSLSKDVLTINDTQDLDDSNSASEIVPNVIEFDCSWDELYRGLKGQADFYARVKSTSKWLSTAAAAESMEALGTAKSISDFFRCWSEQARKPIVMEIAQNRESVYDPFTIVQPGQSIISLIESRNHEIKNLALLRSPWTIEDFNGITIVRNEMRFVDHLIPFNPSALISLQTSRENSTHRMNSVVDLVDASALASGEEQASAIEYQTFGELADFPAICPFLRLIADDPSSLRALKSIQVGQLLKFPISSFTAPNRRRFENSLRRISSLAPHFWSAALWTDFDNSILDANVEIFAIDQSNHAELRFELKPSNEKGGESLLPAVAVGPVYLSN